MRHHISTSASKTCAHQPRVGVADPASFADRPVWRTRILREATAVRRAIRAARAGTSAVVGSPCTITALSLGLVSELFVTRRFIELQSAANVLQMATARGVRTTTITGAAEFELDLIGDGVGALLRRASGESVANRTA